MAESKNGQLAIFQGLERKRGGLPCRANVWGKEVTSDPTFEREQRLRAIARWAEVGVLERRLPLPIEKAFLKRVNANSDSFFKPVVVNNLESVEFHRELSYLLDAFDSLPGRVDQAFDSTWKALELETSQLHSGHVTGRLEAAALKVDSHIAAELCAGVPVQTCEYAYQRLVVEFLKEEAQFGLVNRVEQRATPAILELLDFMKSTYGVDPPDARRKGALLLRRALRGEVLKLGTNPAFHLDETSRARFLVLLVLYTARNERFHGSSFSPFVSSDASLRTYTHPFFAFLASYYLLVALWFETRPNAIAASRDEVLESLRANLQTARSVFGRHWEK